MKLSKKVILLALIITLLMTTLPQSVFAQNEKETAIYNPINNQHVTY